MSADLAGISRSIREFDFTGIFIGELGWDHVHTPVMLEIDGAAWRLNGIAEKRGFQVFQCVTADGTIPDRATRQKIDNQLAKAALEHLIIFTDAASTQQRWQWALRRPEQPIQYREDRFERGDTGARLAQKLQHLFISIDEEDRLTIIDVSRRASLAFRKDKVTRKFYEGFARERTSFLPKIDGIPVEDDRDWYASIMLNRLMFVYFIQQKGFLNSDPRYLRNKLDEVQARRGRDQFYTFYREFLLELFHKGLGGQPPRTPEIQVLLGDVPYLNGGIFEQHQIERANPNIQIPDSSFERIFDFFDDYDWHLDDRPLRKDSEINPDVLGYIFEKYINQKQMGAYYTKEDITEYISKNTIIPFLFDAAKQDCEIAFRPDGALWGLLQDNPDRYIYDAVRKGTCLTLPPEIQAGITDVAKRGPWNRPAPEEYALPTEWWREHVARRQRYEEIWLKLVAGEVTSIDDLITYNLDIRQFAQDVVQHAEGPELVRAFFKAIQNVSVLDPTCGSGAFLFAALNILAPLYDACLERMEAFISEADRSDDPIRRAGFQDFRAILAEVGDARNYYIYKRIILDNLYGVDIMEEAVEICKLRLFLKLASELQAGETPEPLPDIDFNIRTGNTLIGFATLDEVRKVAYMLPSGQRRMIDGETEATLKRINEQAEHVDNLFQQFHAEQAAAGGRATSVKPELSARLSGLAEELDRYMARQFGVDTAGTRTPLAYEERFNDWRSSHQPFHWLVNFYSIMRRGGFDVVIGNPPYVSTRKLGYSLPAAISGTFPDIYAHVVLRCFEIANSEARLGMIIPMSVTFSEDFGEFRFSLCEGHATWITV